MDTEHLEIPISYKGLDAERHEIELVSLGQSLQAAGKLIRSAAQIVIPARLSRIRVVATAPIAASYDIVALVIMVQPILPFVESAGKRAIEAQGRRRRIDQWRLCKLRCKKWA